MYTLEHLEESKKHLEYWTTKFANDSSNNPNKYSAQIRDARINVRRIESYLKEVGILKKSENEIINEALDSKYPYARSKSIHEYNGKKYKIRYIPLVKSRSRKTVNEWDHSWHEVK